mgnify:CR=1 FL=1
MTEEMDTLRGALESERAGRVAAEARAGERSVLLNRAGEAPRQNPVRPRDSNVVKPRVQVWLLFGHHLQIVIMQLNIPTGVIFVLQF